MNFLIASVNPRVGWPILLLLVSPIRIPAALPFPAELLSAQARLTNAISGDSTFGTTVALSGDLAAVGARDFSTNSSVHIYARQGTNWQRQAVVTGANTNRATDFGSTVALDADTLVVGTPFEDVQVFVRSGTNWLPRGILYSDALDSSDAFGDSLALSGNTILVGASLDGQRGASAGAAYVFERSAGPAINAWNITDNSEIAGSGGHYYITNLTAAQYSSAATNGWKYAITCRLLDDFDDTISMNFLFGNASRRFLVWLDFNAAGDLQAELPGATPNLFILTTNGFGADAYHDHELVFNPTNGQATYYFDGAPVTSWAGETVVTPGVRWGSGSTDGRGSMNYHKARFEILNREIVANYDAGEHPSIAPSPTLRGWTVISAGTNASPSGVSPDPVTWWSPRRKLTAGDAAASDFFGTATAIDGNTLVIGAGGDDDGGSGAGSAYVFIRYGSNWTQQAKLTATDRLAGDDFGHAVAIEADRILIGARHDDHSHSGFTNVNAGSVYIFQRTGNNWMQSAKLIAGDDATGDLFGTVVAMEGDTIVVGTENRGAHYVFVRDGTNWVQWSKRSYPEDDATVWQVAIDGGTIAVGVCNSDGGDGVSYLLAPDYASESLVPQYVNKFLYYPNGTPGFYDKNIAAFRYKHLLYGSESNLVRARVEDMPTLYGTAERERADTAKGELLRALSANPTSAVFGNFLLDIYYDRTVAEAILAKSGFPDADVARLGPPSTPGGLIIDGEISSYEKVVETNRFALSEYFALLQDDLGQQGNPPLGYAIFQQRVPARALAPATYLTNGIHQPVVTNSVIIHGYKDLVLLFDFLRYQGRAAATLANLYVSRRNPGDIAKAKTLIEESQKALTLQGNILLGIFPNLTLIEGDGSGLAEAVAGWRQSLTDLGSVQQVIVDEGNLLGFQKDFLMLVQKFAGQAGDIFDSYDALRLRLDPNGSSNPLRFAKDRLSQARSSYDSYRGYEDQLETQLSQITGAAEDRLFELVGAYPGENAYDSPTENEGSEIWQQAQSIRLAQLRIQKNDTEINNLREQIEIEVSRSTQLANVTISYGVDKANLAQELAYLQGSQDNVNSIGGASADPVSIVGSIYAGLVGQFYFTPDISELEGDKEMLAAEEQAEIIGIESAAVVKTLLLGMGTLLVDSQEAALLLKQEWGRYAALLREKENLERSLAESDDAFSGRYFADPVHQLRSQHDTLLAHLSFDEAQKWLYFMTRALEYKWNTPFTNYLYLGRRWSSETLFKLRNAEELELMYNAMGAYESQIQLSKDDYFDWFSVREDFFGYRRTNNVGQILLYADPETGESVNAIEAFRRRLRRLQDAQGNIQLDFSTVREVPGGTFFRGPRFNTAGQILSKGLFMDKIRWMKINLPGSHSHGRPQLAGELTYGGTSFVRNFDVGTFDPQRRDRLRNEMTAYSTRFWFFHAPSSNWRFNEALSSPVTMQLGADTRIPPTVQELDIFKERSVATTGWKLAIPTRDLGQTVLDINELNDVEIYFYHYAVTRP
jgi:hypothetical protein